MFISIRSPTSFFFVMESPTSLVGSLLTPLLLTFIGAIRRAKAQVQLMVECVRVTQYVSC
jgi:hypothetical protein